MTVTKARISGIIFFLLAMAGIYYLTTVTDLSVIVWALIGFGAMLGAFLIAVLLTPVDSKNL